MSRLINKMMFSTYQSVRFILYVLLFGLTISVYADGFTRQQLGMAVTPSHFPNHTPEDINSAFTLSQKLSQFSVFIYQWGQLDVNVASLMEAKTRTAGMLSIIGLSPTTLDQGRKELDIPDAVRAKANGWISFANPVIRDAYKNSVKELAKLQPAYFCLATEINMLGLQRMDEYLHFASLYKEAYDEVKRISPKTRVFVSFQHEWIRILDAKDPLNIKEHSKLIDIFRPALDIIGLTTYPSEYHNSPLEIPADYYSWIYNHIPRSDRVLLMEVGWPTQGSGNVQEQVQYISLLPTLLKDVDVEVLAWALLHDVDLSEFDANLNTAGLIQSNGQFKLGLKAFDDLTK